MNSRIYLGFDEFISSSRDSIKEILIEACGLAKWNASRLRSATTKFFFNNVNFCVVYINQKRITFTMKPLLSFLVGRLASLKECVVSPQKDYIHHEANTKVLSRKINKLKE